MKQKQFSKVKIKKVRVQSPTLRGGKPFNLHLLKEIKLRTTCYPTFVIKQFDLCDDRSEDVDIHIETFVTMKKQDFFDFIKLVADSNDVLWREDRLPVEITIKMIGNAKKRLSR